MKSRGRKIDSSVKGVGVYVNLTDPENTLYTMHAKTSLRGLDIVGLIRSYSSLGPGYVRALVGNFERDVNLISGVVDNGGTKCSSNISFLKLADQRLPGTSYYIIIKEDWQNVMDRALKGAEQNSYVRQFCESWGLSLKHEADLEKKKLRNKVEERAKEIELSMDSPADGMIKSLYAENANVPESALGDFADTRNGSGEQ